MSVIQKYLEAVAIAADADTGLPDQIKRDLARAANAAIRASGKLYRLHHDFETFSEVSLPDVGSDIYSRHPSTEVLMCAYACNYENVLQWVPAEGEELPADLREMMLDPNAVKFAWNKPFEWGIWSNALGIKTEHEHWRDPMVMAYSLSLPGSLDKAGEVVGLGEGVAKMKDGPALVREFCTPRKPTKNKPYTRTLPHHEPAKWERFKLYNRTDVEAERAIYRKLKPFDLPPHEWDLWVLDQKINQAGVPINLDLVSNAIKLYEEVIDNRIERMKEITGLDNPASTKQLLEWLQQFGYPFDDLKKGHVQRAYERLVQQLQDGEFEVGTDEYQEMMDVREVLEMRMETSAASPKKYFALARATDKSGPYPVLRNTLQFAGAGRTWRWAGRMFQAQNLPRPTKALEKRIAAHVKNLQFLDRQAVDQLYPKPMELLKSCIRPAAQAPEGYTFIDADLNAIENRVLGWMASCSKILRVFELNRDPYIDFATYLFGGNYDELYAEYKAGDSFKRTISKPGVLGCGYMLSAGEARLNKKTAEIEATGLLGYAWDMGIKDFTLEQSQLSVQTFRREFEEVVDLWYAMERAMKKCIRTGKPTQCGYIRFDMKAPFCRMILPSGRALHYCRPRLEEVRAPWGKMKETITYEGLNERNQWVRVSTHPGKIVENGDQAIARDLLAHGMMLAYKEGIDIRLHVHDQILGMSLLERAGDELKILQQCMGEVPRWAPGLPLGSAGFVSPIFIKD